MRYEPEVDQERYGVNDRRDQRARHDRRVELYLGSDHRQCAADGFSENNYENESYADNSRDIHRKLVQEHQLDEIGRRKDNSADGGNTGLFPEHFEEITELDLTERQATDDRNACL